MATGIGKSKMLYGYPVGVFAVRAAGCFGWQVDHMPTGCRVGRSIFADADRATLFAWELVTRASWDFDDPYHKLSPKQLTAAIAAYKALEGT